MSSLDPRFLVVEHGVLEELEDNDAALELVEMYDDETKAVLQQLAATTKSLDPSTASQTWQSIWASLHKLKGSSLSIGLAGVAELIESLRASDAATLHEWFPATFDQLKTSVEMGVKEIKAKIS
mmetsp:Transcript_4237/g.11952  ORF Transcript_4237/g.11952 Transcript_4237/m.11952 type:complete len:124 (+) Transcript_4237:38-409(+)